MGAAERYSETRTRAARLLWLLASPGGPDLERELEELARRACICPPAGDPDSERWELLCGLAESLRDLHGGPETGSRSPWRREACLELLRHLAEEPPAPRAPYPRRCAHPPAAGPDGRYAVRKALLRPELTTRP